MARSTWLTLWLKWLPWKTDVLTRLPWLLPLSIGLHNLSNRIGRTLLTTLGIILGVAVVLAVDITNQSTLASIHLTLERAIGKAELQVVPWGDKETLPAELVDWVQDVPGVNVAAPDVHLRTFLANQSPGTQARWSATGVQLGRRFQLHGIDSDLDPQVRLYFLESGRMPDESHYEVITTQKHAQEHNLSLGDDLVLATNYGVERLEIVGLLRDEGVAVINSGDVGFTSVQVVQEMFDLGDELHEISVQVDPEIASQPAKLAELKDELERRLGEEARPVYPAARGDLVPRMLNAYQIGLSFFSVIAVFVGAFLIYNTFSMSIAERTKEIGMYRAIGMSRGQVLLMVLLEASLLGLIGASLGAVTGVWLSRGLLVVLGGFLEEAARLILVSRESLIKSVGTGIAVTLASALLPAIQAANTSPLEALRVQSRTAQRVRPAIWLAGVIMLFSGYSGLYYLKWRSQIMVSAGSSAIFMMMFGAVMILPLLVALLERSSRWLPRIIYGTEGALGSSNVRRAIFRTTLTIACLMVSLVMIIGIGTVSYTFEEDIQHWVNSALGGDVFVTAPDTLQSTFTNQLLSVPGIAAISPTRYLEVHVAPGTAERSESRRDRLVYTAIEPELFRSIGDMVFTTGKTEPEVNWQALEADRAIFISTVVANEYNLQPGDTLSLLTRRGVQDFFVAAITTDFSNQGFAITGTYTNLTRWFIESGVDRFTITTTPASSPQAVALEIETRYQERHNLEIQTAETIKSSVTGMMDQAFQLFDVLTLVGVVIGTLGVINTLTMNVLERRREIGALRSIGMTRFQVVKMVLAESLAMGVMGCIYGLGFGYLISKTFVFALNVLSSYDVDYLFTPQPYLVSALIAVGVSQIAAIGPSWRAVRENIIEAIKHE